MSNKILIECHGNILDITDSGNRCPTCGAHYRLPEPGEQYENQTGGICQKCGNWFSEVWSEIWLDDDGRMYCYGCR